MSLITELAQVVVSLITHWESPVLDLVGMPTLGVGKPSASELGIDSRVRYEWVYYLRY